MEQHTSSAASSCEEQGAGEASEWSLVWCGVWWGGQVRGMTVAAGGRGCVCCTGLLGERGVA